MPATTSKLSMLIDLVDNFTSKFDRIQGNFGKSVSKMQSKFNSFFGKSAEDLDKLKSKFSESSGGFKFGLLAGVGMQAVNIATNAISTLGSEAINAVDSMEKFKSTMNFAGFNDATITQAQNSVKKYAADTVYDLTTVANTTAQLASNGVHDFVGLTQAAGNLNAVAGGNAETFKSLAMQLTQVNGIGKLTTQDWKSIAQQIPGASGKLQEAMRKNGAFTGNFQEAMSSGMITAKEFNQAIMDLGNQPIAVEAAKSTKTFEGALGQLKAGVVEAFSNILQVIGTENITAAITGLGNVISVVLSGITGFIEQIKNGNPFLQIMVTVIGALTAGILVYTGVAKLAKTVTDAWKAAQVALDIAMASNPIGIIVTVIGVLVAIIIVAIKKYDEWGAALLMFLGPIGMVINAFKSIYDHWESIKQAFKTDGIIGGLKRIGQVLLDVLLKPMEQVLNLWSKAPSWLGGGWAKNMAGKLHGFRESMNLVTPGERKRTVDPSIAAYVNGINKGNNSKNLYRPTTDDTDSKSKKDKKTGRRLKEDVNKVTGDGAKIRNITINIDALNKGGINMKGDDTRGLTLQDVENWFNNAMQRVLRNAELS